MVCNKISGSGLTLTDTTSTPATATNGTLILKHTTSGGSSSIVFTSTVNAGSDYAFIQFELRKLRNNFRDHAHCCRVILQKIKSVTRQTPFFGRTFKNVEEGI